VSEQRPHRRMDRRELKAAARIIARLVRSKTTVSRRTKDKPSEPICSEPTPPERARQSMQVQLDSIDLANLEKIINRMKRDPLLGPMKAELGREKATRYAIAFCAEHLPARITATA
jgi:hypothetical protein